MGETNSENLPDIIKSRKMLPYEVKKNIINQVFFNCILFILMMITTLIINISFNKLSVQDFDIYIDIIQIFCVIIAIGILETAYRKDSGTIWMYGTEFLIYGIGALFVPYMYIAKGNLAFLRNVIIGFAIYYFVKSLGTFLHIRHSYLKENISDVKEIVKEDKESYLDEVSTKTLKEQKIEDEKRKKAKEERFKQKVKKEEK